MSTPNANAGDLAESVTRPDFGLARGLWEAPPWAFECVAVLVAVGLAAYFLALRISLRARKGRP